MKLSERWIIRVVVAITVITVMLALPVLLPKWMTAIAERFARVAPPLSFDMVIVGAIEIALVLLVTIWWLWWRLPKQQIRSITIGDPKARADIEDNFRKTIGQALGGIAVLFGAVAAYLQFTQQQNAAHDLLMSNQIGKGFEQLGNSELPVRLGGIYNLEGVMNVSSQYYQPVLEALCAFVRDGTIGKEINDKTAPATDIQAVLRVIMRRGPGPGIVDLAQVKIPHANLARVTANEWYKLLGQPGNEIRAQLGGANLDFANLSGADLSLAMRRQPARCQPERCQPERRQPEPCPPGRRQPAQRQPARRQPARCQPERRQPARCQPERRQPERRQPAPCRKSLAKAVG